MSWLLIAATPALLMLLAVGLERIETGLSRVAPTERGAVRRPNPQFQPTPSANRV